MQYIGGNSTTHLLSSSISVDNTNTEESEEEGDRAQSQLLLNMGTRPHPKEIPSNPRTSEASPENPPPLNWNFLMESIGKLNASMERIERQQAISNQRLIK